MINTASHQTAHHAYKINPLHRLVTSLLCGLVLSILTQAACADTASLTYDPAGNIQSRMSPTGSTTTYGYDGLNRLVTESGPGGILSYAYDANGNRVSDSLGSYTYSPANNQLATRHGAGVTLDAAGNITTDGLGHSFSYNQTGRLYQVFKNSVLYASYYYNYQGERTRKVTTAAAPQGAQTVIYHYDIAGHLLGESSGIGAPLRTYIWRDNTPLAQIDYVPSRRVIYFDADQLNTPRAARDQTGSVVWRWEGDAFGATPPNQNPSGKGIVTVNLRFPGQYFDQESGLSYNGNRDYDPATGRYIESDPIGLRGGINTYGYANQNPLRYNDPMGLEVTMTCRPVALAGSLGLSKPVHCSVVVWHWSTDTGCSGSKTKVIDSQYSLPGGGTTPTGDPNNQTYKDDTSAFNHPGGSNTNYDIAPPAGSTQSDFDKAVTNSGNNYSQGTYMPPGYGPNSNTAANSIITNAGGTTPDVPGAWGQHYSPPSNTPGPDISGGGFGY